jgi:hypothetical protein
VIQIFIVICSKSVIRVLWACGVRASYILVLVLVALVYVLALQSTASQVSVRFRIVSDVNVTKFHVDALTGYQYSLAVFVHDGVLYIAHDNLANGSNIVRADTEEVVKVCSFSDYNYFDHIVAGKGTAYGVMNYWVPGTGEWGTKIIDLWSCRVLAVFENAISYLIRGYDFLFRYDMYSDKLLYAFYVYNETADAELNYVALIDVVTGGVKLAYFGVKFNFSESRWYVAVNGLYAGPDYYYVVIQDHRTRPPTFTMHIYDKNLEHLVGTIPWDPNAHRVAVWYGSSDLAINVHGVLQHKYVRDDGAGNYWYKLVMHDELFSKATEYVTDADSVASNMGGVAAYRDLFVFHNGKSAYSVWLSRVPYVFMLLPIGLAVNTSIAGFAIPVDYELWSSNRVVLFNPATGDVYIVNPPAVDYTIIEHTVTETVTTSVTYTTTTTVTVTEPPPIPSAIIGTVQVVMLLVLVAIIVGIAGFAEAFIKLLGSEVSPGSADGSPP